MDSCQNASDSSLVQVIVNLESLFSILNEHYFGNELPLPTISVAPKSKRGGTSCYGWCTQWKAWDSSANTYVHENLPNQEGGFYEINMCPEYLVRPFDEILSTLLHEMVHLNNLHLGINDTSRHGRYHNKEFKHSAERHGLLVDKDASHGWCRTTLNAESKAFVKSLPPMPFSLYRTLWDSSKSSQSTRKYVCPSCGCIVRATKPVLIICGDCVCEFNESR